MADGTLPEEKFRYYMLQDYLYLRDYVKIFAAIIPKADDFEQIRFLSTQLSDTIGETYRTHLPYMQRLGVTDAEIEAARPHIDNSAYTHYMICEAQAGDVLTDYDKLIDRQLERAAITSISGFAKPYQEASKVLSLQ